MDSRSQFSAETTFTPQNRIDSDLFPESIWKPHLGTDQKFVDDLNHALSIADRLQTYKNVSVLLLSWAENDLTNINKEIQDLTEVFDAQYGFETERWPIPSSRRPSNDLDSKLVEFRNTHENPSELMIVYYGGHAGFENEDEVIWVANGSGPPELNWSHCRRIFQITEADILFIFDRCYAASAIRTRHTGKQEYLAACGKENVTKGSGKHTFTKRLTKHLNDYGEARIPFSILEMQARLVTDAALKHSPVHAVLTKPAESITLRPKTNSLPRPITRQESTARAMISVYFSESVELNLEMWDKWLTRHIPTGIRNVKLEGVFESGSKLVLFSLPIYEWGYLPEDSAYTFVGLITSSNLLLNTVHKSPMNVHESSGISTIQIQPKLLPIENRRAQNWVAQIRGAPLFKLYEEARNAIPYDISLECINLWTYLLQLRFSIPEYLWQTSHIGFGRESIEYHILSTFSTSGDGWLVLILSLQAKSPTEQDLLHLTAQYRTFESVFLMTITGTKADIQKYTKVNGAASMFRRSILDYDLDALDDIPAIEEVWNYIDKCVQMGKFDPNIWSTSMTRRLISTSHRLPKAEIPTLPKRSPPPYKRTSTDKRQTSILHE